MLFTALTRLLQTVPAAQLAVLPGAYRGIACQHEVLLLLWKLLDENEAFREHVLQHCDVTLLAGPILVAMWQARCERMEVAVRKAEAWGRLDHRHRDEMAAVVTGPLPTVARSAPASPPPLLPPSTPLPPPSVLRSPVPDALTRAVHLRVAGTASPSLASSARSRWAIASPARRSPNQISP